MKLWGTQWGGHSWFSSYASNSRGVGILFKSSISVFIDRIIIHPDGGYIILDVILNGFHVILDNVYALNNDDPDFSLTFLLL